MPENDITKMKVADLKRELKIRGLTTTGNKNELQDRLQTALIDGELLEDADAAISGEEELLTDEEEAKILGADENELLKSPTTTPTAPELISKAKIGNAVGTSTIAEDDILESPTTSAKKIVLKRKNSFSASAGYAVTTTTAPTASITNTKENSEPISTKITKMSERNPISIKSATDTNKSIEDNGFETAGAAAKVSQLSIQERLELRAKKFGLKSKPNALNQTVVGGGSSVNAAGVSDEKQMEILKKRAERFGCVVSSKMVKIDAQEKLLKRKQRFGGVAGADESIAHNSETADVWAEKARLRLERFKTAPKTPIIANATATTTKTTTATSGLN